MQPTLIHLHLHHHLAAASHEFATPVVRPLPRPVQRENQTWTW